MATLDELVVRIKADASQLEREMKRVQGLTQQSTNRMQSSFAGLKAELRGLVPVLSVAGFVSWARQAIEAADHMNDLAQRIGFAASTLAALETPLAQSGSSLDEFSASVNILNANIGQALNGDQGAIKAFDRLGLSVTKLRELSPEERFYAIADALSQVKDQAEFAELGRSLLGRGFASMIPLIRQANGEMQDTVEKIGAVQDALSEDKLKAIDEFGDRLAAAAIKARNEFLGLYAEVVKVLMAINDASGGKAGALLSSAAASAASGGSLAGPAFRLFGGSGSDAVTYGGQFGPPMPKKSAKGSNTDLLKAAGGVKQQAKDYDDLTDSVDHYIGKLQQENELLQLNERERAAVKAVMDAQAIAMKEGNLLTQDEIEQIEALAESNYDLQHAMKETGEQAVMSAKIIKDSFADALESAMFDFENFGSGAASILEAIARDIARTKLITPLSNAASGLFDEIFKNLGQGRASGGPVYPGMAYPVGERGAELFVPKTAGTIVPNGRFGGTSVIVQQTFHMSPGLQGTVEAEVRRAAPAIASAAHASVFQAIQRGGAESRIVGKRS